MAEVAKTLEYATSKNDLCPNCGKDDAEAPIHYESPDFEGDTVYQTASCGACEFEWTIAYQANRLFAMGGDLEYEFAK